MSTNSSTAATCGTSCCLDSPRIPHSPSSNKTPETTSSSKLTQENLAILNDESRNSGVTDSPLVQWLLEEGISGQHSKSQGDWDALVAKDALAADIEAYLRTKAQNM